jgi:SH3-like domain-containing protein
MHADIIQMRFSVSWVYMKDQMPIKVIKSDNPFQNVCGGVGDEVDQWT